MKPALFFSLIILFSINLFAQAGTLDQSFGNGGIVKTQGITADFSNLMAIQPDGKIVVAGTKTDVSTSYDMFAVVRYNINGTLDSAFGENGITGTTFPFHPFGASFGADGYSLALQPDGKIVVAGTTAINDEGTGPFYFAVARFNSNGTVDKAFGNNGRLVTNFVGDNYGICITIQTDNKILVGGWSDGATFNNAIIRYNTDGTLDPTFGSNGIALFDLNNAGNLRSIVLQPDGKILCTGDSYDSNFYAKRLLSNGLIDSSFGIEGLATFNFGSSYKTTAWNIYLEQNGKMLISGPVQTSDLTYYFALARFQNNGVIDSSFGLNGKSITSFLNHNAYNYWSTEQLDGKIISCGSVFGITNSGDFALIRYLNNGTIDSSFGNKGFVSTNINALDRAYQVLIQNDGKILAAGGDDYLSLARYNNDAALPLTILSFTASKQNNSVLLNWQTTNEVNNNYFSVEKSNDGNHFLSIGNVLSKGNSTQAQAYSFVDAKPFNGNNFYRLKQVDKNGKFTYSSVVNADFNFISSIKIYPNPAKDILNITGLNSSSTATISIVDASGKIVLQKNISGENYQLNISSLHAGNYFARIESDNKTTTIKFVRE